MEDDKGTILLQLPNNELSELVSVNEICRLCANQNEKLIEIYGEEGENNNLATKINSYLSIKVDKIDNLPLQCCWQCASTVLAWHELVVTSIEVDRRFRVSQLVSFPEKQSQSSDETSLQPLQFRDSIRKKSPIFQEENCKPFPIHSEAEDEEITIKEEKLEPIEEKVDPKVPKTNEEYLQAVDLEIKSCIACNLKFNTRTGLKSHMLEVHKIKPTKFRRKTDEIDATFTCSMCQKAFTRKYDLQRHLSNAHPDSKSALEAKRDEQKRSEFLNKHRVLDGDMVYYKCDKDRCKGKLFKRASFMDHYNIHLNKKLHCCEECGKKFGRSSQLSRHVNQVHLGLKMFNCEICAQSFSSKSTRDEHMNTHTNNRPYMCDLCGKAFKQSSSLYVHKIFHNEEYKFRCQICDKKFKRAGELRKHEMVHTGRKDHKCDVCKKAFRLGQDLKRHIKIHIPLSCKVCSKDFKDINSLKIHKKEHNK